MEKKSPKDIACELGVPAQACQGGEAQVGIAVFKQWLNTNQVFCELEAAWFSQLVGKVIIKSFLVNRKKLVLNENYSLHLLKKIAYFLMLIK